MIPLVSILFSGQDAQDLFIIGRVSVYIMYAIVIAIIILSVTIYAFHLVSVQITIPFILMVREKDKILQQQAYVSHDLGNSPDESTSMRPRPSSHHNTHFSYTHHLLQQCHKKNPTCCIIPFIPVILASHCLLIIRIPRNSQKRKRPKLPDIRF